MATSTQNELIHNILQEIEDNELLHGKSPHEDIFEGHLAAGLHYLESDFYKEALWHLNAALGMSRALFGDDSKQTAAMFVELGNVKVKLGHFAEANQDYGRAKNIAYRCKHDNLAHAEIKDGFGNLYLAQGDYKQASKYYHAALDDRDAFYVKGRVSDCYIKSYINQGNCELNRNFFDDAIKYYEKALRVATDIYGEEAIWVGKVCNLLGVVYCHMNNFSGALDLHLKSLRVLLRCHGADVNHSDIADTYQHIANVFCELNDYDQAHTYNYKSLQVNKAIYPLNQHHISIAANYDTAARIYLGQGENHQALIYFTKSLDDLKISYHKNAMHTDIINAMHKVASVHGKLGHYEMAKAGHQAALDDVRTLYQHGVHIDEVKSLLYLGDLEWLQGDYESAITQYEKSSKKAQCIHIRNNCITTESATACMREGRAWHKLNCFDRAESCYSQATCLLENIVPENHAAMADVNQCHGDLVLSTDGPMDALRYYQKTLAAREFIYKMFVKRSDVAAILYAVADCFGDIGQHGDSLKYHERALSIRETIYEGMNHMALVDSCDGVATAHQSLRLHQRALPYFQRALEMRKVISGADVGEGYTKLGHFHKSKGEYKEALTYFTIALDLTEKSKPASKVRVAKCYDNIGVTQCSRGECYLARDALRISLEWKIDEFNSRVRAVEERNTGLTKEYVHGLHILHRKGIAQTFAYLGDSYYVDGVSLHHAGPNEGVRRQKLRDAEKYYDEALQTYGTANRGNQLDIAGVYTKKCLLLQHDAMRQRVNDKDDSGLSDNYDSALANACKALSSYRSVYEPYESVNMKNHPDISAGYLNVGDIRNLRGEYDLALEALCTALEKLHSYYGEDSVTREIASVHESIGTAHYHRDEYCQALTSYLKSHQMRVSIYGDKYIKYNAELASINKNLGKVYEKLVRHKESQKCYKMVQRITVRSSDTSSLSASRR